MRCSCCNIASVRHCCIDKQIATRSTRLIGLMSNPKHMIVSNLLTCTCSTGPEAATAVASMVVIRKMAEDATSENETSSHMLMHSITAMLPVLAEKQLLCWASSNCHPACGLHLPHSLAHCGHHSPGLTTQNVAVNCILQAEKQLLSTKHQCNITIR